MKKLLLVLVVMAIAFSGIFIGCDPPDQEKIFKAADRLYLDIKILVTDPEIRDMIPEKTMVRLGKAEKIYLGAKVVYEKSGQGTVEPIELLANSADEIIGILEELVLHGKYEREIAAVRIAVKLLRNHI